MINTGGNPPQEITSMDKKELLERIKIVTAERDELSEQLEAVLEECEWLHQLLDKEAGEDG